jgi:hypothetical protein
VCAAHTAIFPSLKLRVIIVQMRNYCHILSPLSQACVIIHVHSVTRGARAACGDGCFSASNKSGSSSFLRAPAYTAPQSSSRNPSRCYIEKEAVAEMNEAPLRDGRHQQQMINLLFRSQSDRRPNVTWGLSALYCTIANVNQRARKNGRYKVIVEKTSLPDF